MKPNLIISCCIFTFLCCPASNLMAAAVYKWKDKDGNVHFSQTPRDADSEESDEYNLKFNKDTAQPSPAVTTKKDSPTSDKPTSNKPMSVEEKVAAMEKQQQEAAKKADQDARNAAIEKDNCDRAQKRLANISQDGRIYDIDKSGKRTYWDDDTRQSKATEAQGLVDKWCK